MEDIIKKITQYINNDDTVSFAYLFGSYARGTQRKDSDVDIAVYLINTLEEDYFNYQMKLKIELEEMLRHEVDIIILNNAPPLLKQQAFSQGHLLKCIDKDIWKNYKIKSFYEYLDISEINKIIFEQTKKIIKRNIENG